MSAPSRKASITICLLTTSAALGNIILPMTNVHRVFPFHNKSEVSVYKAWSVHLLELNTMTLALPAPQQLLGVVNLLFSEDRLHIYVAADIQKTLTMQPGG